MTLALLFALAVGLRLIGAAQEDQNLYRLQGTDRPATRGIAALLAAQQENREFVYFYYVGTLRVEEESDERLLTSLRWFLDGVPEVQRRWRAGTLVGPGTPEKD